ncbi:PEP motif putative anchor domain protein [Gemmatirosa kalamazoonensis]|uniref:PEP motif putative anchor domain protein n=1 Tax=Gemmatirosa kalamazoonensis TaxID=861299 RepID=W0REJ2_9BACT|nr:PEP-CTERM sorting domain-containing protein [Gemmatirosa kalamazoonensis]AHG87798.1 PEP motif putative anchor domain protein [Gemmatirosa kalamazoonensis]
MNSRRVSLLAVLLLAPAAPALAQTVIVTSPNGMVWSDGSPRYTVPFAYDQWLPSNLGGTDAQGVAGIESFFPRSGNGSAVMKIEQWNGSSAGKADLEYFFGGQYLSPFSLGSLDGASYDFYRDAQSTVAANQNPALRFYVDADGSAATTGDRGYLIYEPVYNGNAAPAPDVWHTELIGASSNFWFRQFTPGVSDYTATGNGAALSSFLSYTAPNGASLSANSMVFGLSTGIGSGWTADASWFGAVDNVSVTVNGSTTTFNFETVQAPCVTTPEPVTLALVGGGLLALAAAARRRRTA